MRGKRQHLAKKTTYSSPTGVPKCNAQLRAHARGKSHAATPKKEEDGTQNQSLSPVSHLLQFFYRFLHHHSLNYKVTACSGSPAACLLMIPVAECIARTGRGNAVISALKLNALRIFTRGIEHSSLRQALYSSTSGACYVCSLE